MATSRLIVVLVNLAVVGSGASVACSEDDYGCLGAVEALEEKAPALLQVKREANASRHAHLEDPEADGGESPERHGKGAKHGEVDKTKTLSSDEAKAAVDKMKTFNSDEAQAAKDSEGRNWKTLTSDEAKAAINKMKTFNSGEAEAPELHTKGEYSKPLTTEDPESDEPMIYTKDQKSDEHTKETVGSDETEISEDLVKAAKESEGHSQEVPKSDDPEFHELDAKAPKKSSKSHKSVKSSSTKSSSNKTSQSSHNQTDYLAKMIRPDEWNCDMLLNGDSREVTCNLTVDADALNPKLLSCGKELKCNVEHANSYRTLHMIGALPCCPTSPFCAAPACAENAKRDAHTCTKRPASENVAFMKRPDVWPVYHAFGGAYELDTLKYIDLLGCQSSHCSGSFDLMFDFGANYGYFTEKVSVRNFAKNYIMIEANPVIVDTLRDRWGNATFTEAWFAKQARSTDSDDVPKFEIINQALSNHSEGELDLCETEGSMSWSGCLVSIASVDSLVPRTLSPDFQKKFALAESAFIKVDTEGMDELVLRGMQDLLNEERGEYEDGTTRYLVNFVQFEFAPALTKTAKEREDFQEYDIKTATQYLESMGFETFMIGPRFLPLSHGSWDDEYKTYSEDSRNNGGSLLNYPDFGPSIFTWCYEEDCSKPKAPSMTTDILAMRSSHPRATEIKVALGACKESKDFDIEDPQYASAS
jgi:FkbM family methyltransferase